MPGATCLSVQLLSMWPLVSVMPAVCKPVQAAAVTPTASAQQHRQHQVVVDITLSLPAPCTIYGHSADDIPAQAGSSSTAAPKTCLQGDHVTILAACCGMFLDAQVIQPQQQLDALVNVGAAAATAGMASGHATSNTTVVQVSRSIVLVVCGGVREPRQLSRWYSYLGRSCACLQHHHADGSISCWSRVAYLQCGAES